MDRTWSWSKKSKQSRHPTGQYRLRLDAQYFFFLFLFFKSQPLGQISELLLLLLFLILWFDSFDFRFCLTFFFYKVIRSLCIHFKHISIIYNECPNILFKNTAYVTLPWTYQSGQMKGLDNEISVCSVLSGRNKAMGIINNPFVLSH